MHVESMHIVDVGVFLYYCPCYLRRVFHWNGSLLFLLGWLTREVPGATFLGPCNAGVTCTWSHAWLFYMGARDLNAGSNACRTTIPTHWAISPALQLFLRNYYYFFFLDEIAVGARVSHEVRLWSTLTTHFMTTPGRYAPGASSKMLCHASQYEALGKGPNDSVWISWPVKWLLTFPV